MTTALRIPLYLLIESDNVDRSQLVREIERELLPEVVKAIVGNSNEGLIKVQVWKNLRSKFAVENISIVTASQAMDGR